MDRVSCPRCGLDCVAPFTFLAATQYGGMTPRWACLGCGLAWDERDPASFRAAICNHGGELARQFLDEVDRGPLHDLPDSAPAREVAARVAELDFLARLSASSRITRRYRELTDTTWDEAITATRNWRNLTRDEKLARFGWATKKVKEPVDDLAEPLI